MPARWPPSLRRPPVGAPAARQGAHETGIGKPRPPTPTGAWRSTSSGEEGWRSDIRAASPNRPTSTSLVERASHVPFPASIWAITGAHRRGVRRVCSPLVVADGLFETCEVMVPMHPPQVRNRRRSIGNDRHLSASVIGTGRDRVLCARHGGFLAETESKVPQAWNPTGSHARSRGQRAGRGQTTSGESTGPQDARRARLQSCRTYRGPSRRRG
jgi:hypothetical protein